MKHSFKPMLMAATMLCALSMSLTSCEGALDDILGEWSRPTPGSSTGGAVAVTSIDLDADEMKLAAGDKGQLTAKVDPAGTAVTWSSDKEEIATVDENGMVTAVAMGTAIITAKAGDKSATCEVTVLPTLSTPLTVEAITAGTIKVAGPKAGMQYSLNGGAKTAVPTDPINVAAGGKVAFYGQGISITQYAGTQIGGTAQVKVYGNIMSLVDEENFATKITLPDPQTFEGLFMNYTTLKDASGLLLPATDLSGFYNCYSAMFKGCTSLTAAPALKATTLANACYYEMFKGCTSLTTAPELPATDLTGAVGCYQRMFEGTALTAAPELKAETLKDYCYREMFKGCTSLTTAPELKATTLKQYCYYAMFDGCTSLTTAYVKAAYITANNECTYMFDGCTAAGAVLHTTTANKGDWSSGVPGNWTVADDWN